MRKSKSYLNYGALATFMLMASAHASAENQMVKFMKDAIETVQSASLLVIAIFFCAGLWAVGSAGMALYNQDKQGGQKPEMKHVFFKIIAGGIMVAITGVAAWSKLSLIGESKELRVEKVNFN